MLTGVLGSGNALAGIGQCRVAIEMEVFLEDLLVFGHQCSVIRQVGDAALEVIDDLLLLGKDHLAACHGLIEAVEERPQLVAHGKR